MLWNVRTLYQAGKVRQLAREMDNYNIDICGISECRWTKSGKETLTSGKSIVYSGCQDEHIKGVAIVMSKTAQKCLEEWEPISERIIRATFNSRHMKLTILQCYAPTNEATDEEKDCFYEQLQAVKERIPKHDICIIMGDFNAKVGQDNINDERTMGRYGMGQRNENGQKLVDFCSENGMVITGTLFQHKNIHKST